MLKCPQCNASLTADAPAGLCPRCALMLALAPAAGEFTAIGPYRIVRLLGAGGMGSVFLAEQSEPIQRQVALKVMRAGLGSEDTVRRFETERQALALMNHPNIARVLDAGSTPDGRLYFAMEYVPGIPITAYCDEQRLPARERLWLFGEVCRAIHHAHQKGVIHRDIKPSNVLVAERDGKATAMVIDFGIAKAVDHPQADETLFTREGLVVGTPEYMSPEQAASSADIDTTTDVYSLGVLLYELLTGVLPFEPQALRERGYLEILRAIREDDPPRPAARLRAMGETAEGLAERRSATLPGLVRQVEGDLDWITMRALEKERSRRYGSAAALAEDVERHLRDEAVSAGRPGRVYQWRKTLWRHRVLTGAVVAVLVALSSGLWVAAVQYKRAESERQQAERERRRAEAEARLNRRMLYAADMSRASQAWQQANVPLLQDLLTRHLPRPGQEDPRGFEWFYWWRQANADRYTIASTGSRITFMPNGKLLAIVGPLADPWFWDLAAERAYGRIRELRGAGDAAFSPDSKLVAFPADQGVHVLSPDGLLNAYYLGRVTVLPYACSRLRFSPGGAVLAMGLLDGRIILWDVAEKRERLTLRGMTTEIGSIGFSPDDRFVVATSPAEGTRIWEVASAREVPYWGARRAGFAAEAQYSPNGKYLAESGSDGRTLVWDLASKRTILEARASAATRTLAFSPDSRWLAAGSDNREVAVYELTTGREAALLKGHGVSVDSVAFSPDGKLLASGGGEGNIRLWDVAGFAQRRGLKAADSGVRAMAYSPDGRWLATGGEDKRVTVWDVTERRAARRFAGNTGQVVDISFSPDGSWLAAACDSGSVRTWQRETGREIFRHDSIRGWVDWQAQKQLFRGSFAAFFPKNGRLLIGHDTGSASVRRIDTGKEEAQLGIGRDRIFRAAFAKGGNILATVGDQMGVDVRYLRSDRDSRPARPRLRIAVEGPLPVVALSPDSTKVATANRQFVVEVWDTGSGQLVTAMKGSTAPITALEFSPDSRRVMAAGGNREVRLWDAVSGQDVAVFTLAENVSTAAFSPDGRTLAVGDARGNIHFLETASPKDVLARLPAQAK